MSVDRPRVELFRREGSGPFTRVLLTEGATVELASINLSFPIDELYALLRADQAAESG